MGRRVQQQTRTFPVRTEDGQHEFQAVELTEFDEGHTSSGFRRVEVGKELRTDEGHALNYVSKGKYHHVAFGLDLVSDDPNAP